MHTSIEGNKVYLACLAQGASPWEEGGGEVGEEALKLELEAMKRDEWEEVLRPHVQQEYYLLAQVHEWLEHLK
jgi:hypothetical protein